MMPTFRWLRMGLVPFWVLTGEEVGAASDIG
jgi:hypothetical protein